MDVLLKQAKAELELAREMIEISELIKKKEKIDEPYWQSARRFEERYEKQEEEIDSAILELDRGAIMLIQSATDKLADHRHRLPRKELKII